uniref:DDE_Tnp_1_7 domain-containing protein n=1 Tax=Strongyloides stercoralis TaxID=6248 RepID=A0A0K0DTV0_STRER
MDSENLKHRFDDGSISQMMFYNNLTEVAKQTSLEEAQAAISALLDSNIEDDIEGNLDEMQDDEDDTPLSHLSRKTNKEKKKEKKDVSRTRKTCVLPITHFTAENNKNNYVEKTPLMYFSKYFPEEIFVELAVKTNMLYKWPLKMEKELKKIGRGCYDSVVTDGGKIVATRWYDNKCVNMASNFVGNEPMDEVRRWGRKKGEYVMVKRSAILEYQADINWEGISKKFGMDLLEFTLRITQTLAFSGSADLLKRKKSRLSGSNSPAPSKQKVLYNIPKNDIRYDNIGYWPIHNEGHEQRCKLESCKRRSRPECDKCNVPLCLSMSMNCFKIFNTK